MNRNMISKKSGPAAPASQRRCVTSRELLQGDREIAIRHGGQEYRLQVTKNGKLILTK